VDRGAQVFYLQIFGNIAEHFGASMANSLGGKKIQGDFEKKKR
jgi:hypothetical protein